MFLIILTNEAMAVCVHDLFYMNLNYDQIVTQARQHCIFIAGVHSLIKGMDIMRYGSILLPCIENNFDLIKSNFRLRVRELPAARRTISCGYIQLINCKKVCDAVSTKV